MSVENEDGDTDYESVTLTCLRAEPAGSFWRVDFAIGWDGESMSLKVYAKGSSPVHAAEVACGRLRRFADRLQELAFEREVEAAEMRRRERK